MKLLDKIPYATALFVCVTGRVSHAEDEMPATTARPVETVVVVGESADAMNHVGRGGLAGSYDVTTRAELDFEHPDDTLELLTKTPGVQVQRYNQGVYNTNLSIRGFAGDGPTPHAKFMIDGIPALFHEGFPELDQIFPMAIDHIYVFKGTSDVRYGTYNLAGNFNVVSRSDEAMELQATIGGFDLFDYRRSSFELQSYMGHTFGRLTQNLSVGFRQSGGYRDHSDLSKYAVSGRWFYEINDYGSLGFIVRVSGYESDSPGFLTKEVARNRPTSSASYANQDGGGKYIQSYSLHLNQAFVDETLRFSLKTYLQEFERERWVRFFEESQLQDRYDDQQHIGAIATIEWDISPNLTVSAGVDYEDQDVLEQRFLTIGQSRTRDTSNTLRNNDLEFQVYGGFVQVEQTLFERFRWNAGLRADYLDGDFSSFDDQGLEKDLDIYEFGIILQPKVNLFVDVVAGFTLFGNYGRSFQHPFRAALFTSGSTSERSVSLNDGFEVGARWSRRRHSFRASYWMQIASDEWVSIDGTLQNVGQTQRQGVELAGNWSPLRRLNLWGNFSYVATKVINPGQEKPDPSISPIQDTKGNRIFGVPDYSFSAGARYLFTDSFFARIHVDGQGSYYVNQQNKGGTFGEYVLTHVDVGYETDTDRVILQVNNLFDQFYEYVFDFSKDGTNTIHSPGNGINVNLSYTRKF